MGDVNRYVVNITISFWQLHISRHLYNSWFMTIKHWNILLLSEDPMKCTKLIYRKGDEKRESIMRKLIETNRLLSFKMEAVIWHFPVEIFKWNDQSIVLRYDSWDKANLTSIGHTFQICSQKCKWFWSKYVHAFFIEIMFIVSHISAHKLIFVIHLKGIPAPFNISVPQIFGYFMFKSNVFSFLRWY